MSEIAERGYAHPEALVSTDWVAEHLDDPNVRIVESDEDPLLYASGHIPGAVQVDWTRDLNDPLRRDYLDASGFEALMRAPRHHAGHDRRLLRRQEQLVGQLRLLGLPALRPHERQDHGRRAHEVGEGGPRMTRDVPSYPPTQYQAPERDDTKIRAFRDEVLQHVEAQRPAGRRAQPGRVHAASGCTCPSTRKRARCAAATSPARRTCPGRAPSNPDDGTFKTRRRAARDLRGRAAASSRTTT